MRRFRGLVGDFVLGGRNVWEEASEGFFGSIPLNFWV